MPTRAHVRLAAALVVQFQNHATERWILRAITNDARGRAVCLGLDVRLIDWPRIDECLRAAARRVDRTIAEPEGLRASVDFACSGPGFARARQTFHRWRCAKRLDCGAHLLSRSERRAILIVHHRGVRSHALGFERLWSVTCFARDIRDSLAR